MTGRKKRWKNSKKTFSGEKKKPLISADGGLEALDDDDAYRYENTFEATANYAGLGFKHDGCSRRLLPRKVPMKMGKAKKKRMINSI